MPSFSLNKQSSSFYASLLKLARFHAPVGIFLFYWPFLFGLLMSAYKSKMQFSTMVYRALVYGVTSATLRSAACVWNDICDVDFDRQVERTKSRPLASGAISMQAAYVYLAFLSGTCVMTFCLLESESAIWHSMFNIAILNFVYPLTKRVMDLPQAWLGFAINWGFVISWMDGAADVDSKILICGTFSLLSWTIVYDTIYACQDLKDDRRVGLKSSALFFGAYLPLVLQVVGVIFVCLLALTGHFNDQSLGFYIISVVGSALHMLWQLKTHDPTSPTNSKERFNANITLGAIISSGLMVDYVWTLVD